MAVAGNPAGTNLSFETDLREHLDTRGLTFEDLRAHQCTDNVLLKLSKGLDNWDIAGLYLKITLAEIKVIKVDNSSEESRKVALLNKWKQKNGDDATYYNLIAGLHGAERIDIADQALDFVKESQNEVNPMSGQRTLHEYLNRDSETSTTTTVNAVGSASIPNRPQSMAGAIEPCQETYNPQFSHNMSTMSFGSTCSSNDPPSLQPLSLDPTITNVSYSIPVFATETEESSSTSEATPTYSTTSYYSSGQEENRKVQGDSSVHSNNEGVEVKSQASEAEAKQIKQEPKESDQEAYKKEWEEYYMKIACLAALKSEDPRTPVGACIVDTKSYKIVGIGYNIVPSVEGVDNDKAKNGKNFIHAVYDAIKNSTSEVKGCTMYTTLRLNEKSAHAIQLAGIKEVVHCMYARKEEREELSMKKAHVEKIFKANEIKIREMRMLNEDGVVKLLHNRIEKAKGLEQFGISSAITYDEFFMGIAILSTKTPRQYDKQPNKAVGACIVSPGKRVVAVGYSGYPENMAKPEEILLEKDQREYIIHAEYKAIIGQSVGQSVEGCTLYVTSYPCNECAKLIVHNHIDKVLYDKDKGYKDARDTLEGSVKLRNLKLEEDEFYSKL